MTANDSCHCGDEFAPGLLHIDGAPCLRDEVILYTARKNGKLPDQVIRRDVLLVAAGKLDAQASAHGEGIHDYTDLLRVWAGNEARWENGS